MIVIFAETQIKEEKIAEFERVMRVYETAVNELEPGCVIYCMARCNDKPGFYRNVEIFRDQSAIELHGTTSHFKTAIESTHDFFVGMPKVEICESLQ